MYQHHTVSGDLCHDWWLSQGQFGRKHTNVFSHIYIQVIVYGKQEDLGGIGLYLNHNNPCSRV